jgi:hypothetical protein
MMFQTTGSASVSRVVSKGSQGKEVDETDDGKEEEEF